MRFCFILHAKGAPRARFAFARSASLVLYLLALTQWRHEQGRVEKDKKRRDECFELANRYVWQARCWQPRACAP